MTYVGMYKQSYRSCFYVEGFSDLPSAKEYVGNNGKVFSIEVRKIETEWPSWLIGTYDEGIGEVVNVIVEATINRHCVRLTFEVQLAGEDDCSGCLITTPYGDEAYKVPLFAVVEEAVEHQKGKGLVTFAKEFYKSEIKDLLENDGRFWTLVEREYLTHVGCCANLYLVVEKSNDGIFRAYTELSGSIPANEYDVKPDFGLRYYYETGEAIDDEDFGSTKLLPDTLELLDSSKKSVY